MSPFTRWLLLTLAVLLTGSALFLLSWEIAPPTERIEMTLPDERFPR